MKKTELDSLIPPKTSKLLESLAKSADDVDDVAASLKRAGADDVDAVASIAKTSSLSKHRDICQQLTTNANDTTDILGKHAAGKAKLLDGAVDATIFKNADELTASLKQSSGLSKSADDVPDTSAQTWQRR